MAPNIQYSTSERPRKIVVFTSEGLFLSLGWAPVFGRAARFGLRGHGLSLAMMVLAAIRFACPSGHAVAPGLTNRRTPRPSP